MPGESDGNQDAFLRVYGQVAMTWAQLENVLCHYFTVLTRMDPTLARRVFFSARNFTARTDMLEAAVSCPTVTFNPPRDKEFITLAMKLARNYSAVRNVVAHDSIVYLGFDGHKLSNQWVLVHGKYDRFLGGEDALDFQQLRKFHRNLSSLFMLLHAYVNRRDLSTADAAGNRCLALLKKLPTKPREKALSDADSELIGHLLEPLKVPPV